jgi:lytic murein transglycosylase
LPRAACTVLATLAIALLLPGGARADQAFRQWLQETWPEAQKHGVSRATFERATRGLEPDLSLPDLVIPGKPPAPQKGQPEFVRTPAQYLAEPTLERLATEGRKLAAQHRHTLARIEREIGVPGNVVLAIFGRETNYGNYRLPHNAIRVLATQAYLGKRKDLFREEFLLALKILDEGHVTLADMKSSWAGAMGLTQFMPSDFFRYAVDFDGDGRRDIWNSIPDALASAARQLAGKGWQRGKRWAYEVRVPPGTDCTIAEPDVKRPIKEWLKSGFVPVGRSPSPAERDDEASLFLPAGPYGPAFLTPANYYVLKGYNFADLYALFVGDLSDRIAGRGGFVTKWAPLSLLRSDQLEAMQRRLAADGFYRDKIDGKAGMKTRAALGAYQKSNGLSLDCWPSPTVLDHMRRTSARN